MIKPKKRTAKGGTTNHSGTGDTPVAHRLVEQIPIEKIHPHPANRDIDPPSCAELAQSITQFGLRQPIELRQRVDDYGHWNLPEGHYQIVFGERRYWAAQIAGMTTISAVVVELSDAETLQLIATENGQREDVGDIERGRLLQTLTAAVDKGGGGLLVKDAASVMGVQPSTASNLIRVAALPKCWTSLVISGEMPGSYLRPIAAFAEYPEVLKLLMASWQKATLQEWFRRDAWSSRAQIEATIVDELCEATMPLSADDSLEGEFSGPIFDAKTLDVATRKKLKITKMPRGDRGGRIVSRCWGVKTWRELQDRGKRPKQVEVVDENGKPPTAAELKAAAKRKVEQHRRSIERWRLEWLRWHCQLALQPGTWQVTKMAVWLADRGWYTLSGTAREQAVRETLHARGVGFSRTMEDLYGLLGRISSEQWDAVACDLVRAVLYPGALGNNSPRIENPETLPIALVEGLSWDLGIDLAETWSAAQSPPKAIRPTPKPVLFMAFFELHTIAQLESMMRLWKRALPQTRRKRDLIEAICRQPNPLPLPKSIRPLKHRKSKPATKRGKK